MAVAEIDWPNCYDWKNRRLWQDHAYSAIQKGIGGLACAVAVELSTYLLWQVSKNHENIRQAFGAKTFIVVLIRI
jgi:hypothetical protein